MCQLLASLFLVARDPLCACLYLRGHCVSYLGCFVGATIPQAPQWPPSADRFLSLVLGPAPGPCFGLIVHQLLPFILRPPTSWRCVVRFAVRQAADALLLETLPPRPSGGGARWRLALVSLVLAAADLPARCLQSLLAPRPAGLRTPLQRAVGSSAVLTHTCGGQGSGRCLVCFCPVLRGFFCRLLTSPPVWGARFRHWGRV